MTVTIRISETGSVEIPLSVREANGWTPGTELELVERGREVLLRPKRFNRDELFPPISVEEFLARRPKYDGPPITDEMIEQAVLDEAKRRWNAETGG